MPSILWTGDSDRVFIQNQIKLIFNYIIFFHFLFLIFLKDETFT